MSRRAGILLTITALCWGASFALIKYSLTELDARVVMAARCAISLAVLWPFVVLVRHRSARRGEVEVRKPGDHWWLFGNGVLTAAPFFLVAWGIQSVDSGIAGVINASVPVWAALLALRWDQTAPLSRTNLVGVGVGFMGVVFLIASRGTLDGNAAVFGLIACSCAALLYAISGIFVRRTLGHRASSTVATWSVTWGAILLTAASWKALPDELPSGSVLLATLILGVVGTGVGMLTFYELLAVAGAARASLVTYLLPPLALVWGAVLLGEHVRPDAVIAMALILGGVWAASRAVADPQMMITDRQ